jgi:hypothetical protein
LVFSVRDRPVRKRPCPSPHFTAIGLPETKTNLLNFSRE